MNRLLLATRSLRFGTSYLAAAQILQLQHHFVDLKLSTPAIRCFSRGGKDGDDDDDRFKKITKPRFKETRKVSGDEDYDEDEEFLEMKKREIAKVTREDEDADADVDDDNDDYNDDYDDAYWIKKSGRDTDEHDADFSSDYKPLKSRDDDEEDPFGVMIDDEKSVHTLPPLYRRDPTTGKMTGEVERELTDEDRKILGADPLEQNENLRSGIEKLWKESGIDGSGLPEELDRFGESVARKKMAMNRFGRSNQSLLTEESTEDGTLLELDETGFSKNLTKEEFAHLKQFAEMMKVREFTEDDLPVQEKGDYVGPLPTEEEIEDWGEVDPQGDELAMKWLSVKARAQMEGIGDNPYAMMMPNDLVPTRKVNRRRAKKIPDVLLHHNNIELLRLYLSNAGTIKSRVQTRLGARDQRKVSRIIKRARNMGIIPYENSFRVERHGWIHAKDLHEDRDWEKELKERGLTIKPRIDKPKVEEDD